MIDEDPRFPNRRKRSRGQPDLGDEFTEANLQGPNGEIVERVPLPVSGYRVVGVPPKSHEEIPAPAEELKTINVSAAAERQAPVAVFAAPEMPRPGAPPPIAKPTFGELSIQRIRKFAESPTRLYATLGVGLLILLGIVVGVVAGLSGPPTGRYDLGQATSSAAGLTGHLFVQWDKKLQYRLTVEPADAEKLAGFALAVASSPRPLSVEIHLQNSEGFVLCTKEIALKYDPRNAAAIAAPVSVSEPAKTGVGAVPSDQPVQIIDYASLDAQEAAREQGKDIFKNQIGSDGQIAAINAQGDTPCSAKAYEDTSSWSFTPNFPSLAEQEELLKHREETRPSEERPAAETTAARKKADPKATVKLLPFSIEGDDSIVEFDTSRGVIETVAGKIFFFDKAGAAAADTRWQDYPVSIHYRCDRNSECTLMHGGAGSVRARLRR